VMVLGGAGTGKTRFSRIAHRGVCAKSFLAPTGSPPRARRQTIHPSSASARILNPDEVKPPRAQPASCSQDRRLVIDECRLVAATCSIC